MTHHEWQDLKTRFENHLSAEKNLAPLTIRNYSTDLRPLTEFMEARSINRLHDLDRNMLRAYLAWLVDTGYAKSSIVRKLSVLRTFISWLLREGVIEKDPLPTRRTMKRESRLPRFLSELEVEQLLEAPDTSSELGIRDRAILEILYAAGIRVSEAHNLNVPDVNLQTREMRVRGKGSKERAVLVGATGRQWLTRYLLDVRPKLSRSMNGVALFLNSKGDRLTQRSIQRMVRKYASKAGLRTDVHTHTLRHSFATHLLDGGAELRVVQELLGHASPAVTQVYTHVTRNKAREVYLSSHPRASKGS